MPTNTRRPLLDLFYTSAPQEYDGFGTVCHGVVGRTDGNENVRLVAVDPQHALWQRGRYESGMYFMWDRERVDREAASGWFHWSASYTQQWETRHNGR